MPIKKSKGFKSPVQEGIGYPRDLPQEPARQSGHVSPTGPSGAQNPPSTSLPSPKRPSGPTSTPAVGAPDVSGSRSGKRSKFY